MSITTPVKHFEKSDALKVAEKAAANARISADYAKEIGEYAKQVSEYQERARELSATHVAVSELAASLVGKAGYNHLSEALENLAYDGRSARESIASAKGYRDRTQARLDQHEAKVAGTVISDEDDF